MTNIDWNTLLLLIILFFVVLVYLGIGFILLLGSGEGADFKVRIKTIFGWPKYLIEYIIKGHPDDKND